MGYFSELCDLHVRHKPNWMNKRFCYCSCAIILAPFVVGALLPTSPRFQPSKATCRGQLWHVYRCPNGTSEADCLCDPPREDGTGCNTDGTNCNAGAIGPYFRFLNDLPAEEQKAPRVCFGLINKFHAVGRRPKEQEINDCAGLLPKSRLPFLIQVAQCCGLSILIAATLWLSHLERKKFNKVKRATVRLGLYDRDKSRFFDLASGSVVSSDGHILTAAHVLVDFNMRSRTYHTLFSSRREDRVVIVVGLYQGDGNPARWSFWAERVSMLEVLKEMKGNDRLDLAVVKIMGPIEMEPPVFGQEHSLRTPYSIVNVADDAPLQRLSSLSAPRPLPLKLVPPPSNVKGSQICVVGWPSPGDNFFETEGKERTMFMDCRTCISHEDGFLKSAVFIHTGSSGGPLVNTAGEQMGVASYDNDNHRDAHSYVAVFRSVAELRPDHGLPGELMASIREVAPPDEDASVTPLAELPTFQLEPIAPQVLKLLSAHLDSERRGGTLALQAFGSPPPARPEGATTTPPGRGQRLSRFTAFLRQIKADKAFCSSMQTNQETPESGIFAPVLLELSPVAPITLSPEQKAAAKIPETAVEFAFIHPLKSTEAEEEMEHASRVVNTLPATCIAGANSMLDHGGFVYFSNRDAPVTERRGWDRVRDSLSGVSGKRFPCAVNVFGSMGGPTGLMFRGPHALGPNSACRRLLENDGRLHDVTLDCLLEKGVERFAWLRPEESFEEGGQPGGQGGRLWPKGGFAYFYDKANTKEDCVFSMDGAGLFVMPQRAGGAIRRRMARSPSPAQRSR